MGKRRMEARVLEEIIKKYIFPDVPWKLNTVFWDDPHKKVTDIRYSKEFQEYIRQKEEIEEKLYQYGITKERFIEKWNELLEKEEDGELVRQYFLGSNFSQLGREYFMSERTVARKIDRFLGRFFRSLFL